MNPAIWSLRSDMARKKPVKVEEPKLSAEDRTAEMFGGDQVRTVKIDTRRLLTIDTEHPDWSQLDRRKAVSNVEGAIVRLRPPHTVSDADVERVRVFYEKVGAARVTVLPRPRVDVVPNDVAEKRPEKAIGAREAVLTLIRETNSKDRDLLRELCERVMAECGV